MDGIIIYLNGKRGLDVIDALVDGGHDIVGAFVQDTHLASRKMPTSHRGINFNPVNDFHDPDLAVELAALKPEIGISAGFNTILPAALFLSPRLGSINLHAGPLPEYRGGSPLNWQLINGETEVVISIHRIDSGIDTGDVLGEISFSIDADDTIADVHNRANQLYPQLLIEVLIGLENENIQARVQDNSKARYWHQRSDDDGLIDFASMTSREVHNKIRALSPPYPGAFAWLGAEKVRILKAQIVDEHFTGAPGHIIWRQGNGPYVVCKDRALLLIEWNVDERDNSFPLPFGRRLMPWPLSG